MEAQSAREISRQRLPIMPPECKFHPVDGVISREAFDSVILLFICFFITGYVGYAVGADHLAGQSEPSIWLRHRDIPAGRQLCRPLPGRHGDVGGPFAAPRISRHPGGRQEGLAFRFLFEVVRLTLNISQLIESNCAVYMKEEVSPPEIDELVGLSGHSYPAQLIRDMEICLLKKLEWVISIKSV